MRYSYSIHHVLGKCLWIAYALSRAPVQQCETPEENEDLTIYVHAITENLPAPAEYLDELRAQLKSL